VTLTLIKSISINSETNLGKNNLILNFQFINSKISLVKSLEKKLVVLIFVTLKYNKTERFIIFLMLYLVQNK